MNIQFKVLLQKLFQSLVRPSVETREKVFWNMHRNKPRNENTTHSSNLFAAPFSSLVTNMLTFGSKRANQSSYKLMLEICTSKNNRSRAFIYFRIPKIRGRTSIRNILEIHLKINNNENKLRKEPESQAIFLKKRNSERLMRKQWEYRRNGYLLIIFNKGNLIVETEGWNRRWILQRGDGEALNLPRVLTISKRRHTMPKLHSEGEAISFGPRYSLKPRTTLIQQAVVMRWMRKQSGEWQMLFFCFSNFIDNNYVIFLARKNKKWLCLYLIVNRVGKHRTNSFRVAIHLWRT